MPNNINITVTAEDNASKTVTGVEKVIVQAMGSSEEAFDSAARSSGKLGASLDLLSGAGSQAAGGVGDIGDSLSAVVDLQKFGQIQAMAHAQSLLDLEQAQLDYNATVEQYGAESLEARQAQLALNAAQVAAEPPNEIAAWGEKLQLVSPIINGVVGALDLMILANNMASAAWIKNAAAMTGAKIALAASTIATGVQTVANYLLATSTWAALGPILIIIAVVALLVGGIIWLATKTTFFQDLWAAVWSVIGDTVKATWAFIQSVVKAGVDFVINYFKFIFALPGKIASVFATVGEAIFAPFKWAFNMIAKGWNNTIGKLSWSFPGIFGMAGFTLRAPQLPTLQHGGEILRTGAVLAHKGERIMPAGTRGLFNDVAGGAIKIFIEIVGGHDSFRQFIKENVKIYGAGSVVVAYDN